MTLPEENLRELHRKPLRDKTWANFKTHFLKEVRDFKKDQGLTARKAYSMGNLANQALLQAQVESINLTQCLIDYIKSAIQEPTYFKAE